MNEEHSVLHFFAQEENLPLALVAAEHLDGIRQQHNNRFWEALREHLDTLLAKSGLPWRSEFTEDRNAENCLVGLHLEPLAEQRTFLRPFMEQQLIGGNYRIYYGLMWNAAPEPAQRNLPAVETLQSLLSKSGFKQSDSFLAWQWSPGIRAAKIFCCVFQPGKTNSCKKPCSPGRQYWKNMASYCIWPTLR